MAAMTFAALPSSEYALRFPRYLFELEQPRHQVIEIKTQLTVLSEIDQTTEAATSWQT
jgi:hypothetical protein